MVPTPVLAVASEVYPLVKTGGLADVVGALPGAVAPHGFAITTLLPGYPAVLARCTKPRVLHRYDDLFGTKSRLLGARVDGLDLLLLDAPDLYARDGGLYGDAKGHDWPDNWRRFAALARVAADIAGGLVKGLAPALVHAHDWQAALAPLIMRHSSARAAAVPSLLTIHNIAFQGRFDAKVFPELGLPPQCWSIEGIEYFGGVGFLKAGLAAANAITTVSPTYAREIRAPAYGMGLEGLIAARGSAVSGIVNGIDPAVWNPATDTALPARYTAATLPRRARNRAAIEAAFGLSEGGPLLTVISRLTWQKGIDVLVECLDALVARGCRLALLGSGDAGLEAGLIAAAERHPGRIGVRLGYDEALSHRLQGGSDAILVPSRFEPCGLTQLYGLAYGCIPLVARTGGLADTIIDANPAALGAGVATGFQFDTVTPAGLLEAIDRMCRVFTDPPAWQRMQRQAMRADNSWARSGALYAELYRHLIEAAA